MTRFTRTISLIVAILALSALIAPAASAGAGGMLANPGFESHVLAPWTLKHVTGDKAVCGGKAPAGYTGNCAFVFKGSASENSTFTQKAAHLGQYNQILAQSSAKIMLSFGEYSDSDASSMTVTLYVRYKLPGNPNPVEAQIGKQIIGQSLVGGVPAWTEQYLTELSLPAGAKLLKVEARFQNQSHAGKLYIDDVDLYFFTPAVIV